AVLSAGSSARSRAALSAIQPAVQAHFSTSPSASTMGLPISEVSRAAYLCLSALSTPATERRIEARTSPPASRQACRVDQARSMAASIPAWSNSGNVASSRPVAGSTDLSTLSNHGTIYQMARAPVKRRLERPALLHTITPDRADGRRRVVIESVTPEIDGGQFAAKRTIGESVTVEADVFSDGHEALSCVL